jgi:protein-S-isoprenylcysteine O-methyltransferase Ste14
MDMIDSIFFFGFIGFCIILVAFIARMLLRGINIFASPPINPAAFITAKLCAFSSCFFIPLGVLQPGVRWYALPEFVQAAGLVLFFPGIFFAVLSMKKLGDDLIFGLPESGIDSLKTDGVYAASRNPLYLGFILIILSSWVCTPNPINISAGLAAILLHHRIVLREEGFLISKLGINYTDYMKKTGRYLFYV